ncbi:hypothetical protein COCSUDRAFT_34518 [Coccomyxa subellipsoidea C-169]|uniref:Uncharacterized protein n=1 Tax=Coccomyxa subellipsoidea (strain C-169) TaxID=574566 RepID=I0YJJ8_COCSC|nr:hypothetical protein COCSUDRAFT_34518 [Coccomyxa subellipsoidea C-169]EIE18567.1 hypothetical protein COCSUDRAFT_34518 [Coccomyxa subellipsoidea C-169]|eukprot:XP_005643111.1 hypothetical protein COCSUDRAFT_34518 [Coccomyxa subellipsoidea C-169]
MLQPLPRPWSGLSCTVSVGSHRHLLRRLSRTLLRQCLLMARKYARVTMGSLGGLLSTQWPVPVVPQL